MPNDRGRVYQCGYFDCSWDGERYQTFDHYAKEHSTVDNAPFLCVPCQEKFGLESSLRRHLVLRKHLLKACGKQYEEVFIRHSSDDILSHFTALSQCELDGVWKASRAGSIALLKEALDNLVDEGDEDLLKIAMSQAGLSPIQRSLSPIESPSKCSDISDRNVVIGPVTSKPEDIHSLIVAEVPNSAVTENEMSSEFVEVMFGTIQALRRSGSWGYIGFRIFCHTEPRCAANVDPSGECFHENDTWRRSSNDERDCL